MKFEVFEGFMAGLFVGSLLEWLRGRWAARQPLRGGGEAAAFEEAFGRKRDP